MQASKSVTAKLLATENITVVQDNVPTAMFDVKNRVLTLPLWADVESYTEDHLIGHEVGHALYTPLEGWHDAVCDRGANFKSFLNVVEDARIEKLVQRKYAGLRTIFIKSYRKLLADGFFGGDIEAINSMGFIDRINTYFKCGASAGIEFSDVETPWLARIEKLETWEETVALTEELFEFCKQQKEEEDAKQEAQRQEDAESEEEEGNSEDDDFGWGEGDDDDWGDDDESSDAESTSGAGEDDGEGNDGDAASASADEEGDDAQSEEESDEVGGAGAGRSSTFNGQEPRSVTDESLREHVNAMSDTSREVTNFTIKKVKYSDHIITYKEILQEVRGEKSLHNLDGYALDHWRENAAKVADQVLNHHGAALFNEWQSVNKKAVNHMVKEFEMKKQASEFARASTAKTGVIDTIKMNNYKLTDDIFKKVTILPEGKNHGFIMYLDMSGSMCDYIYETVEQLLLLTSFARQIGVPFRVYGFSDRFGSGGWANMQDQPANEYQIGEEFRLLELFTNEMSKNEFTTMAKGLLCHYMQYSSRRWELINLCKTGAFSGRFYSHMRSFDLGGTPLDSAIFAGMQLAIDFRTKYRVDILNTFFLTDGASHPMDVNGNRWYYVDGMRAHTTVTCPITNTTYKSRMLGDRKTNITELLMEMYKNATGSNMIGYFICKQTRREITHNARWSTGRTFNWDAQEDLWKQARTEGYVKLNVVGYDEFFIIGDKSLKIEDNKLDDVTAGEVSKAKLRGMFKKAQVGGKKSRAMLNDIVDRVA